MILKTSSGIELFYESYGERGNTPVVLVHGAGADHKMWLPQIAKYPAEGLVVIVPDMRGHGNSSKVVSFKIKDCAKDINDLLEHFELAYKGADKEHVRRYFREAIAKTGIRQARLDRDEANKFNILNELDEVRAPTLVLVGDSFGEWFVNLARETAKRIKGARFKVLKGGQDPSNLVVPDLFDNEVLNFIRAGNAE